ncbi:MAG: hypothetical protein IT385_29915 [Deltaproteobacteria bacterium]|nr:hypothetical protein [Deltaproteobacteria bacterium]
MRTLGMMLVGVFVALSGACATAVPQRSTYELDRIVVIPKLDTETISSKTRQPAGERGERASEASDKEQVKTHTGTWLARYRWEPYESINGVRLRRLATIEIIFCPFDQSDFTRCRVGVAWSRSVHPLGEQRFQAVSD